MKLQKLYYTLPQLAEKLEVSEEEILHFAKSENITLSLWWRGWVVKGKGNVDDWEWIDEYVSFDGHLVAGLLPTAGIKNSTSDRDKIEIREAKRADGSMVRLHAYHDDLHFSRDGFIDNDGKTVPRKTIVPPSIDRSDIMVLSDEVARIDARQSPETQLQNAGDDLPIVAVGWKKKKGKKRKDGLKYIDDATGMSQATVKKYAAEIDENFLEDRRRKDGRGKGAIELTQIDVIRIIEAKKNY